MIEVLLSAAMAAAPVAEWNAFASGPSVIGPPRTTTSVPRAMARSTDPIHTRHILPVHHQLEFARGIFSRTCLHRAKLRCKTRLELLGDAGLHDDALGCDGSASHVAANLASPDYADS